MQIKEIKAHNFRSYEQLDLKLNQLGLTLLTGGAKGATDNRRSSGFGKSSIVYALIYALYGQLPDGSKGDDVIKNDVGKNCYAQVIFEHGGHNYQVSRYRKDSKHHNKVLVSRDKKDITLSTNKETDQLIIDTLGFGFDTLLNSLVFSPERLNSFINATDKNRKQILEELTNTNVYKQAQQLVKIDAKDNAEKLSEEEKDHERLITLKEGQEASKRAYMQNKDYWDKQMKTNQDKLAQYKNLTPVNNQDKLNKLETIKTQLRNNQSPVDNQEIKKLDREINGYQTTLSQGQAQTKVIKDRLAQNLATYKRIQTGQQTTCELCGSVLEDKHKQLELTNLGKKIKLDMEDYKSYMNTIDNLKQSIDGATKQRNRIQADQDRIYEQNKIIQVKLDEVNETYHKLQVEQQNYDDQLRQKAYIEQTIKSLKANPIEEPKNLVNANYDQDLASSEKRIQVYQQQAKDLKKLDKIYSDKGVKATALSLVIPYLNQKLSKYLEELTQGRMNAYLSSTSKTKTGKVQEQISLNVESEVMGDEYQELSSGEKQRVGIALNLAFMNYLADQIGGVNLCFFDEIFDHLDQSAIDSVVDILKSLKGEISNVIVISHNNDLLYNDNFDTHIRVNKVDNTSTMELQ